MVPNALTKIRVEAGCISLACRKGTVRIATQASPRSILADYTATRDTILELVYFAEPEVPMIELAFGEDEPTQLEFDAALVLARYAGVRRVVWTSRLSPHASVVTKLRETSASNAGWLFLGSTKWSGLTRLAIADGEITVEFKDGKQTYALPKHPHRLLFPSLAAMKQLLVAAKRDLMVPDGSRVEIVLPEATSELEQTAFRDAVIDAFNCGQAKEAAKPDGVGLAAIATSVAACIIYAFVARSLGHEVSAMVLASIPIGGWITFYIAEAWLKNRATTSKLKRLLQPW